MRFVPAYCLRPNQMLATDLIWNDQQVLLKKGVKLTSGLIRRIQSIGYQGLYISDNLSEDIQVSSVISDSLKHKAKREIESLFINVENKKRSSKKKMFETIDGVIDDIVEEILYNRNIMVNVVDIRTYDDYTFSHSVNVAVLSAVMGAVLKLDRKSLKELAMGALIHDVGKVFIDKDILNKPAKLTAEEFEEVKQHCKKGYDYLVSNYHLPKESLDAVLTHHEQYSGNGYPGNLIGEDIPLFGRIICVSDVYDALTSNRAYRNAMLPSDAIEYIMGGNGGQFDPKVVKAFITKVAPYPIGTCIELSTGAQGIVIENYETACLRPKLRLISGNKLTNDILDLANDRSALNVTIVATVNL